MPSSKRVLITGADGFIGSHLTETLVRAGYDVRAFVLYNSFGSRGWLDHCGADVQGEFEVFAGDIRDTYSIGIANIARENLELTWIIAGRMCKVSSRFSRAIFAIPMEYVSR